MKSRRYALLFLGFLEFYGVGAGLSALEHSRERELYRMGQEALASDYYLSALDSFRAAIHLNPSYADARLGIAKALYLLGEYLEAYKEITAAKAFALHDRRRIILEARILTALGKYDEAALLYNGILADRPYDPEANQGLGEIYAIQGKRELADRAYEKSLEYSPGNLRVLLQLVILHDRAREKTPAENALKEAMRLYPDDLHVRIQAAEHHALYDEWEKASDYLDQALAMLRGPQDGRYRRVSALNASLALRRGDPAAALAILDTMGEEDEPDILFLRARAYRDLGQEARAQAVLRLLLRLAPEDEVTRIFREAPLVQSIGGLMEYRTEAASWHVKKGKRLEEAFYYGQALAAYRRARRIDSTNIDSWLLYSNLIRLMGFPEKYRDELNAAVSELDHAPDKQAAVRERLSVLEHSENDSLAQDWGVDDPWNYPPSVWSVGVFFAPERQVLTSHDGAGAALASYFADLLDVRPEVTVVNLDGGFFPGIREAADYTEAFKTARGTVDYFVMLEFAETERSFSAAATVYLGRTGESLIRSTQLRTGQEKVFDSIGLLVRDLISAIPLRMSILAVEGDMLLADKGRWHGIDAEEPMVVLRRGAARPSISDEGIEYAETDFLGTVEILRSSESLSEGRFLRNGDFDFVSAGDEFFSIAVPENSEITSIPDPAFRSRLLSVP